MRLSRSRAGHHIMRIQVTAAGHRLIIRILRQDIRASAPRLTVSLLGELNRAKMCRWLIDWYRLQAAVGTTVYGKVKVAEAGGRKRVTWRTRSKLDC